MKEHIENLKIEKLVYKGYGLGFYQNLPVFVTNSVPGDVVDVEVAYTRGKVTFASIKKIISPSEWRIMPDCEVFANCGGCDWLNIAYERQLELKQQILAEIFQTIPIDEMKTIAASPQSEYYRNKSFFPISAQNDVPIAGMYARKSHQVVPHRNCKLHPRLFDEIAEVFLGYVSASHISIYNEKTGIGSARHLGMRYSEKTDQLLVMLVSKTRKIPFSKQLVRVLQENFSNLVGVVLNVNPHKTNVILGDDEKILSGCDHIFEEINGKRFKLNYHSFFQVNTEIAAAMYEFVKRQVRDSRNIVDAYCGVGSIGIYLSDSGKQIFGIESNSEACRDAAENVRLNRAENYQVITDKVEEELIKLAKHTNLDTIIFDPPRKGLDVSIFQQIPKQIKKIIYISCDPNTQRRDVIKLMEIGFQAKMMQPFDMFPQTYHIENVLVLER